MADNNTLTRSQRVTVLRRFLINYSRLLACGPQARLEGSPEEREEAVVFFAAMVGPGARSNRLSRPQAAGLHRSSRQ